MSVSSRPWTTSVCVLDCGSSSRGGKFGSVFDRRFRGPIVVRKGRKYVPLLLLGVIGAIRNRAFRRERVGGEGRKEEPKSECALRKVCLLGVSRISWRNLCPISVRRLSQSVHLNLFTAQSLSSHKMTVRTRYILQAGPRFTVAAPRRCRWCITTHEKYPTLCLFIIVCNWM